MQDRPASRDITSGDRYAISFRRQFLVITICLLAVNLLIGLFARHQQRAFIDYSVNIYDNAFISTNYVSLAQTAFRHYVDNRARAVAPLETARANELLETVLDDMDVAIERSATELTRAQAICAASSLALRHPERCTRQWRASRACTAASSEAGGAVSSAVNCAPGTPATRT